MGSLSKLDFSAHMRSVRAPMLALLAGLLVVFAALHAQAQSRDELHGLSQDPGASYFATPKPGVGIKRATAIARKHTGGRVLSASPRQSGQVMHYRVRVLVGGERVVTVTVDQDGQIIRPD
jgi:uncharacterized membrane protein YkoI